ncbi:hypothetical protein KIN20_005167 [Parelaphostrongylus tenuis]|uniref:Uncharacterized protein n=1 Tax=Parelaphostrongylus tenuis TaxID=148309 RepID=A0AAD5MKU3_PARTN|nr:hypothetical protein KIN20_005167 [Parelaphostrongylus tenuis]
MEKGLCLPSISTRRLNTTAVEAASRSTCEALSAPRADVLTRPARLHCSIPNLPPPPSVRLCHTCSGGCRHLLDTSELICHHRYFRRRRRKYYKKEEKAAASPIEKV